MVYHGPLETSRRTPVKEPLCYINLSSLTSEPSSSAVSLRFGKLLAEDKARGLLGEGSVTDRTGMLGDLMCLRKSGIR